MSLPFYAYPFRRLMSGQAVVRADISAVTKAERCEITTSAVHGLSIGNYVRVTDLGNAGLLATDRGMDEIDTRRFDVYVTSTTTFLLRDPITKEYIDSTNYVTYVEGGMVTLEQQSFNYEGAS